MFLNCFVGRSMETGAAVTGQELRPGFQQSVNPDGYVTIDVESFSHVIHQDFFFESQSYSTLFIFIVFSLLILIFF